MATKSKTQQILPFFSQLSAVAPAILLFLLPAISAVDPTNSTSNATDFIRTSCNATLYPDLCYTSLSGYSNAVQQNPGQLARVAIRISLSKAHQMTSYISNITNQTHFGSDPKTIAALHDCHSTFNDAVYQIKRSLKQMFHLNHGGGSFRFLMSNVQTWMSAALTNEETCTDGFELAPNGPMKSDVCNQALIAKKFASNALALVNSFAAKRCTKTIESP
ncbi:Pectinesterase inhibitor domain [Macleaya cordata]|uniref:Pectinesterase inhibitor domain n=1 Tax=Macleaya cordata TaxID=56857 RepID=A0A200R9L8_MACCD|nr:Pectinesterase inhibitor domain [Macleaya cordata]